MDTLSANAQHYHSFFRFEGYGFHAWCHRIYIYTSLHTEVNCYREIYKSVGTVRYLDVSRAVCQEGGSPTLREVLLETNPSRRRKMIT
jgi:hypothetical protein